jgi:hypothetical protein
VAVSGKVEGKKKAEATLTSTLAFISEAEVTK